MATINLSEDALQFMTKLAENAESEKATIADAMSTAISILIGEPKNAELLNVCAVLAHFNNIINKLFD